MIYFFAITLLAALNPGIDEARSLDFLFADASYYLTVLIVPTASTPTVQVDMLQAFLVSV